MGDRLMHIDWPTARDTITGMAIETAGRTLGWCLWLAGLWLAVAMIVGSVVMANWIAGWV